MLQNRSVIEIVDNTEVLEIRCFRPRGTRSLGDLVTGSVIKVRSGKSHQGQAGSGKDQAKSAVPSTHKRGDVVRAVIVNTRGAVRNPANGMRISFGGNAGILMTHSGKEGWVPVGSRVLCAVPRRLRLKGWGNIVARASGV